MLFVEEIMTKPIREYMSVAEIERMLAKVPAHRAGLPARDSIVGITETPKLRIIHTQEADRYDEGAVGFGMASAAPEAAPRGDNYVGTDRRAAKLSIATGKMEMFQDVKDVIDSLVPEAKMKAHNPKIEITAASGRVKEEQRNVHVNVFIYAASHESDNDFHLIVGRDPNAAPEMYMTMEVSGLPPAAAASFRQLQEARNSYKDFFDREAGGKLPGSTYDFYDPPIAVTVEGSLFFDMTHTTGSRPGPASLKSRMPVIWEIHPVTKITFQ